MSIIGGNFYKFHNDGIEYICTDSIGSYPDITSKDELRCSAENIKKSINDIEKTFGLEQSEFSKYVLIPLNHEGIYNNLIKIYKTSDILFFENKSDSNYFEALGSIINTNKNFLKQDYKIQQYFINSFTKWYQKSHNVNIDEHLLDIPIKRSNNDDEFNELLSEMETNSPELADNKKHNVADNFLDILENKLKTIEDKQSFYSKWYTAMSSSKKLKQKDILKIYK